MMQQPPTFNNAILDNTLGLLAAYEAPEFKAIFKETNPCKIDMNYIAKALQKEHWKNYTKEYIKNKLINDGYIKEHENGNLSITLYGLEFQKEGGYYIQELNKNQINTTATTFSRIKQKFNWEFFLIGSALFIIQLLSINFIKDFFK
ncbi:hypothetical protein FNB79_02900 [Formosa sediminum]|uniref:Uncharacterized protein n=1 Tax=Formosa sediminum TaxID=2594004 RepID=A0A516GN59_9FLAO|nr:hypothetical protein [Formosa sediminum]QDO92964.1 hypothetical protein FNB79_02900 [Formosa sediminum]